MVHAVIEAAAGDAPSCMWVIGGLVALLIGAGGIIAKLATALWSERMSRITDREEIRRQLIDASVARNRRETTDRREPHGPF